MTKSKTYAVVDLEMTTPALDGTGRIIQFSCTFIENGKNGMLLPYNEEWTDFKKEEVLTKAIIELFTKSDVDSFNKKSYQIAEPYLTKNVAKQWKNLVGELVND